MSQERTAAIDPYHTVLDEIIPAEGRAAFSMDRGQVLRIVNLEGHQVADLIAFNLHNYEDKLSVHNTLLLNGTLFITTGNALYSTHASRLMTIVEDTVGVHDLIAGTCSEYSHQFRYGVRNAPSCRRNFELSLRPWGIPIGEVPYSFSAFMNMPVTREKVEILESPAEPGDYLDLRADMDLLIALSNCPSRRNPCNGYTPTPLRIIVVAPRGLEL